MLITCVTNLKGSWDDHRSLIEFAYNNSYHSNIEMNLMRHCMTVDVDLQVVGLK